MRLLRWRIFFLFNIEIYCAIFYVKIMTAVEMWMWSKKSMFDGWIKFNQNLRRVEMHYRYTVIKKYCEVNEISLNFLFLALFLTNDTMNESKIL